MDFGLRFNSHSYPLEKRTSLTLGDAPMEFQDELMVGFHFNFYAQPLFGTIVSINTDDGNKISVVASHQGQGAYLLGLVVNEKIKLMGGLINVTPSHEDKIDLKLNKSQNVATLSRNNNDDIELPLDLSRTTAANIVFGIDKEHNVTDVAPIEIRNIRVFVDHENTNYWDFKYHDSPATRIDELNGVQAVVTNPHWLIDDHTDWHLIYSETIKDNRQTAFDPESESFYIVGNNNIKVVRPLDNDSSEYTINGGYRPMAYSNHIVFDTITENLINYNLSQRSIARLSLTDGVWNATKNAVPNEEANYANHAFTLRGDTAYAFGGYGFYKFHNDLFSINLVSGDIQECKLQPEMSPTTSAAATVIGDKLYIFGGKGNSSGRQELPSKYRYSMHVYDVNTWKGELLWELDSVQHDYLPSQTMYYDADEDCFYAGSTCHGGELIKISRTKPLVTVVSNPINSKMEYHDIVFDLFRSNDQKRYYLLIDKRIDANTHDYSIYTISAPFLDNPEIIKNKSLIRQSAHDNSESSWWIWIIAIAIISCLCALFLYRRKSNKKHYDHKSDSSNNIAGNHAVQPDADLIPIDVTPTENHNSTDSDREDDELLFFDKHSNYITESKFDRSKSAISLLGAFNVHDKNGEDITDKFTDRLKSLLILLLLSNCKSENGIKYQTIDEVIWSDKYEKSAQNNRNVYMRKLRLLLEEIGDVQIIYEKGYFKILCNDVTFDYGEAIRRINEIQANGNASPELINETLDLLLMGPLLPMTHYEWLDQYKADYSSNALEILNKLLRYEFNRNDELSLKIAHTISCHEILSEEAMKAKCILLSRKKMVGQAKNVYAKFCKEYSISLGEEYPLSFVDVCKSQI